MVLVPEFELKILNIRKTNRPKSVMKRTRDGIIDI